MTVEHILAEKGRNTITVEPHCTLAEAVAILHKHRIGALVVVDGAQAVKGIVSERDVVRAVAKGGGAALESPVSEYMTTKVATCLVTAPLNDLMGMMTQGKFRHVPVVENGRLGGMVSIGDIVKYRLAEMEAESRALREYITTG